MARFTVNKNVFQDFIDAVECTGIIHVDNHKVKKGTLFENFLMVIGDDGVKIVGTDTKQNKVLGKHALLPRGDNNPKGVEVEEEGEIPITSTGDLKTAVSRCTGGIGRDITILYPTEDNKIMVMKEGTSTAWSFPTKGKKAITSLENANASHEWKEDRVVSVSKKTGNEKIWDEKLIVLPDEIKEIAKDMNDFVKEKKVTLSIDGLTVLFKLGEGDKKGKRQLMDISRQRLYDDGWGPVADQDMSSIESDYFHGFYAVLQSIPSDNMLEIHFTQMGSGYVLWVHSTSTAMELNYLVPYENRKK